MWLKRELVIWFCLTENRLQGLRRRGRVLNGKGAFCVLGSGRLVDIKGEELNWNR